MSVLAGVFVAALLAATVVPFYSEVAVGAAIIGGYSAFAVWLAASLGNTLGAVINGILGRTLGHLRVERLMCLSPRQAARARDWFQRWGAWSLLLAWLPIGGDALTVVAGIMRVDWLKFVVLVFVGKSARYGVLIWVVGRFSNAPA